MGQFQFVRLVPESMQLLVVLHVFADFVNASPRLFPHLTAPFMLKNLANRDPSLDIAV